MKYLLAIISLVCLLVGVLVSPVGATDVTVTASPSNPAEAPTVTASNATDISISSAVLHGNITDIGGGDVPLRGFEWGFATGNYTYSWNGTGSFGVGVFERYINSLPLNTQVFWRAYAENDVGRGNSTELSFWTSGVLYAPTNFTITQIGPSSVSVNWTKGIGAENTVVRGSIGGFPRTVSDGWLAYSGNGTSCIIEDINLSTGSLYVRAWSEAGGEYSEDYAEASIGGDTLYMIAFLALGIFFMWLAWKSRELLICLVSFFIWLALALWLFFSNASIFDLSQGYVQILAYVFFIVGFVPLLWSMNQEIRHEAEGQKWTTYGKPPKTRKISPAEAHRKRLRDRMGR